MHIHFIQHVAFEYPGSILDWAEDNNHITTFTRVFEEDEFPLPEAFDMLVIMGGPMGVYEEDVYPWMIDEKACIKAAIDDGKKVLGICLGAQFIANVLGQAVYPHTVKEIGWWPVQKVQKHPLTDGLPAEFTTFHWHSDTFGLPAGAVQLFKTEQCAQQGFVYNNHVVGLQFHMEVKEDLLNGMTEHEGKELTGKGFVQTEQTIASMIGAEAPKQAGYMKVLLDNFIKM